ncbi:MAG: hypothetical protein HOK65_13575 [Crocinitomicaceae bacterium]|nr:hypothetical protein [Crocinitomicaceae bacterium]
MKAIGIKLFLPVLVLLVAGNQYYTSKNHNLTKWKGGGFGMYSEMHFGARDIWVQADSGFYSVFSGSENYKYRWYANKARIHPNSDAMNKLADCIKTDQQLNEIRLQVWEVIFDAENFSLTRNRLLDDVY